jgi:phosphate uptake regulator
MWKELIDLWKSDNLLKQALDQSYKMLDIDHEMFKEAVKSLRHTDADVDVKTRKKDKLVNKYEREVRRKVLTHLAVSGSNDLASGLVLTTIIIDIERIGDYIKNILDLASLHIPKLQAENLVDELVNVEKSVGDMFEQCINCFKSNDAALALKLMGKTRMIGKNCDALIEKLIKDERTSLAIGIAVAVALYVRYLKRINAHLRNITSSIVNPFDRIGYKYKDKS